MHDGGWFSFASRCMIDMVNSSQPRNMWFIVFFIAIDQINIVGLRDKNIKHENMCHSETDLFYLLGNHIQHTYIIHDYIYIYIYNTTVCNVNPFFSSECLAEITGLMTPVAGATAWDARLDVSSWIFTKFTTFSESLGRCGAEKKNRSCFRMISVYVGPLANKKVIQVLDVDMNIAKEHCLKNVGLSDWLSLAMIDCWILLVNPNWPLSTRNITFPAAISKDFCLFHLFPKPQYFCHVPFAWTWHTTKSTGNLIFPIKTITIYWVDIYAIFRHTHDLMESNPVMFFLHTNKLFFLKSLQPMSKAGGLGGGWESHFPHFQIHTQLGLGE